MKGRGGITVVLSDIDIAARLVELGITTNNPNFPFNEGSQIKACSVDLRLSNILWVPRGRTRLDLSKGEPLGRRVSRAFVRKTIGYPKGFRLRPGHFVIGRTYESFSIPPDLMGRLIGRSSFGRLGLSVSAQSNLINPGWSGHMPVILVNHSPFDLIIHPYLGVVQLCLVTLSQPPKRPYGSEESDSKYINDDGGPSRYWLDQTITDLRTNSNVKKTDGKTRKFLELYSAELDEPTRERFGRRVEQAGTITDIELLVDGFVRAERLRGTAIPVATILLSIPFAILTSWLPAMWGGGLVARSAVGVMTVVAIAGLGWVAWTQWGTTIAPYELRRLASSLLKGGHNPS